MSTYKITNITNSLGKRESNYNSILDIDYADNMVMKKINVKPNTSIYLTTNSLPLSVHRLRMKNLITVVEISDVELAKIVSSETKKHSDAIVKETKSLEDKLEGTKKYFQKKLKKDDDEVITSQS